jgi:hypothetical protein
MQEPATVGKGAALVSIKVSVLLIFDLVEHYRKSAAPTPSVGSLAACGLSAYSTYETTMYAIDMQGLKIETD